MSNIVTVEVEILNHLTLGAEEHAKNVVEDVMEEGRASYPTSVRRWRITNIRDTLQKRETFTDDEICRVVDEALQHVSSSGGKKTPGVLNRLALVSIIQQLQEKIERLRA